MKFIRRTLIPLVTLLIFLIILILLSPGFLSKSNFSEISNINFIEKTDKKSITVGQTKIFIDIADNPQERQEGLSGRTALDKNHGMLFVFDKINVRPVFWMKEMKFAIDIIWIKSGEVTQINENIPPPSPNTLESELPLYQSLNGIDYVLEVNAGFVEEKNIQVGNLVDLTNI